VIGVNAFTPDSLGRLVKHGLAVLAKKMGDLDASDRAALERASAHALRHTFGTVSLAAKRPLPLDVVQAVLGHASLQTTTIYVRSASKRMMEATAEMVRFEDSESEGQ
jgi:integrase